MLSSHHQGGLTRLEIRGWEVYCWADMGKWKQSVGSDSQVTARLIREVGTDVQVQEDVIRAVNKVRGHLVDGLRLTGLGREFIAGGR